ncbi:MAG TPA: L-rhamnose/proton symporter RhaT [Acidobacteriaceae bacterium]|jgi:L-rhamnose-H+ transport protein|nr:L-rhamnose/proton symporter RhaT [Acidobacteriaceae bacterium]
MNTMIIAGALLAVVSGLMNGSFTLPMRFLGRWEWENVWAVFIVVACLLMPAALVTAIAPHSWALLLHAPGKAVWIAALAGFAWGFGAILFGQSVSAIGISLANTLVLAISSALGSLLPLLLLAPGKLLESSGRRILGAVAVELVGIALCGWAGGMREKTAGIDTERGEMVGHARPIGVALLMACGSGVLSAVFNIGFSLAAPIAAYGRAAGLSQFSSTNLIWMVMLGAGSVANLGFCGVLLCRNRSAGKFTQPGKLRFYGLASLMALLWGGSIFVYGAAAPRLGSLGTSIGWPLSLAVGLLLANFIGMALGEWRRAPQRARTFMYAGIAVLIAAIVLLSRAGA